MQAGFIRRQGGLSATGSLTVYAAASQPIKVLSIGWAHWDTRGSFARYVDDNANDRLLLYGSTGGASAGASGTTVQVRGRTGVTAAAGATPTGKKLIGYWYAGTRPNNSLIVRFPRGLEPIFAAPVSLDWDAANSVTNASVFIEWEQ